jgi:hypothetical protein
MADVLWERVSIRANNVECLIPASAGKTKLRGGKHGNVPLNVPGRKRYPKPNNDTRFGANCPERNVAPVALEHLDFVFDLIAGAFDSLRLKAR